MSLILLLGLVLIIEGLGIAYGHTLAYFIILLGTVFLFASSQKKLVFPRAISLVFIALLGLLVISTLFSLNIPHSLQNLLFYPALFLGFVYAYNQQLKLKKPLFSLIFILAILFSLYSLFLQFILGKPSALSLVANEYNFVFPVFGEHNHLATFLVLAVLLLPFFFKNKLFFGAVVAFFLLLIALSYSRSANMALFFGVLFLLFHKNSRTVKAVLVALLFLSLLVLGFSFVVKAVPTSRLEYLHLVVLAIKQYPLFGVGLGNFRAVSLQHSPNPFQWVDTSHNLFADMFAEAGVLAGAVFLILILLILIRANKNSPFFPAFLALVVNFQTIYTYKIYSFCFLSFVIAGLLYKEKRTISENSLLRTLPLLLLFLTNLLLLPQVLPGLNLQDQIAKSVFAGRKKQTFLLLKIYKALYRGSAPVYNSAGDIYNFYGEGKQALAHYRQAYKLHPYEDITLYRKIYRLEEELNGKDQAQIFLSSHLKRVQQIPKKWFPSALVIDDVKNFCKSVNCPLKITDLN